MRKLSSLSAAIALAVVGACSTTSAARSGEPSTRIVNDGGIDRPAEDVARDLLLRATAMDGAGDDDGARTALRRIVDEFADTRSRGPATVRLAALLLAEPGTPPAAEASAALERFLLEEPAHEEAGRARALLQDAQRRTGKRGPSSSSTSLDAVLKNTPESERGAALVKLGRELLSRGQSRDGVVALLTALPLLSPAAQKAMHDDVVFALDLGVASGGLSLADVAPLRERFGKTDAFADEVLTWKLARASLHLRNDDAASRLADELLKKHPTSRFAKDARTLVERLRARVQTDPRAVGVVLPLTGEYAAYGKRALIAIRLALRMPIGEDKAPEPELDPSTGELVTPTKKKDEKLTGTLVTPTGLKLVVKDSAGKIDVAQRAVRELVESDHVIAVLGDILVDTSLPIALACEDLGVPMLSLSRRDGVPEAGPWSFRLALTPHKQAEALAHFAVDGLKMKRFAMMYPKKPFGVELMNEFWDALDARRAEVTAIESYAHDQTTFTDEAKSLVGRGLGGGGRAVAECREQAQSIDNDYRRKKVLEGCADRARPIVDFEALFIPDGARGVSFVVPALIAEDVLLTHQKSAVEAYKKATGNDRVRPVQLLGASTWNDPDIANRLGRQVDGAVFVDGFDPNDQGSLVQGFVESFQRATRSRPALVEAQAYDGARLLGALLDGSLGGPAATTTEKPQTRSALQQALGAVRDFNGVTGTIAFDAQGDSQTPLVFFEIDREKVERIDEAELVKGAGG